VAHSIRTKLLLVVVAASLITGFVITLVFAVLTFQQSEKDNREHLDVAKQAFVERLNAMEEKMDSAYMAFQNQKKLNTNVYYITNGDLLEFHMIPEINNLGITLGVERFAFYTPDEPGGDHLLQLYYYKNFKGNVIVVAIK